jgi:hypothetical protein
VTRPSDQTKADTTECLGVANLCRYWCLVWLVVASVYSLSIDAPRAQVSGGEILFDIPAQPLAAALRAYSEITGFEVFYDGSLSIGRRSTAIKGTFTPSLGLKMLLRGTGYVARNTEMADAVTIVNSPSVAPLRATFSRYESYFATLQARLSEVLCESDKSAPGGQEITFRFWVDTSGVISHAELVDSTRSGDWFAAIAAKITGLQLGKSPPAGLPEPLTMVIYPPSDREGMGCSSSNIRHAGDE